MMNKYLFSSLYLISSGEPLSRYESFLLSNLHFLFENTKNLNGLSRDGTMYNLDQDLSNMPRGWIIGYKFYAKCAYLNHLMTN